MGAQRLSFMCFHDAVRLRIIFLHFYLQSRERDKEKARDRDKTGEGREGTPSAGSFLRCAKAPPAQG